MILNQIQKKIEETYQIDCPASVEEFLIEEEYRQEAIRGQPWLAFTDEALLVAQDEDANLEVGLFYSPKLLQWAEGLCWNEISKVLVRPDVLQRFGPLVEGVSHFVYLIWRATRKEPVTQLELELQAEIDKFVLFSREMSLSANGEIFQSLFYKYLFCCFDNIKNHSLFAVLRPNLILTNAILLSNQLHIFYPT